MTLQQLSVKERRLARLNSQLHLSNYDKLLRGISQYYIQSPVVVLLLADLLCLCHTLPARYTQSHPPRPAVWPADLPQDHRGIVHQEMVAASSKGEVVLTHSEFRSIQTHHSDFLAISTAVTTLSTALCNLSCREHIYVLHLISYILRDIDNILYVAVAS